MKDLVIIALVIGTLALSAIQIRTAERFRQERMDLQQQLEACNLEVDKLQRKRQADAAEVDNALRSAGACHAELSEAASTLRILREGWAECAGVPRSEVP